VRVAVGWRHFPWRPDVALHARKYYRRLSSRAYYHGRYADNPAAGGEALSLDRTPEHSSSAKSTAKYRPKNPRKIILHNQHEKRWPLHSRTDAAASHYMQSFSSDGKCFTCIPTLQVYFPPMRRQQCPWFTSCGFTSCGLGARFDLVYEPGGYCAWGRGNER
jgi:hypothetical protein